MNDEFQLLRELLAGRSRWPDGAGTDHRFRDRCNGRLFRALRHIGSGSPESPGAADLAALVRHVLRREQESQDGASPLVAVPDAPPWPSREQWRRFGIEVRATATGLLHIVARPWCPPWLQGAAHHPPDREVFAERPRRSYGLDLPGDPFLDALPGWRSYRCSGQREGVRSLLTAPEGSTLVVNLPTGAGKSLCAQVASLVDPKGLSVVVVPTTALALDQERALEPFIGHPTAYFGGTTQADVERNGGIRERIREGTQRIVFTSPESLLRSLAGAVYATARLGLLRLLVVDEAHIIDQWGDGFRSEFQELAGLRRDLLRSCPGEPFRTLLLTGTLTSSCLDTLETLFGRPGPLGVVSSVQLRPEPSYWVADCRDEEERRERVLESLRLLPRPLILYVSAVEDANAWLSNLRGEGFLRAAVVTGQTGAVDRSEIIRRWQYDDLDAVVATSAFGLGMDKGDVRAVIHACIPEHIDRFYQEVGRGGRDGKASLSLLLHTPSDRAVASDLNQKAIISVEKGFERWKAIFHGRTELPDGRVRVRVDSVPSYGYGVFENSSYNVAWNVRTLTLLSRAGIIELDAQPPPSPDEGEESDPIDAEERHQSELDRHRNERVLRILDEGHLDFGNTWTTTIEGSRRLGDRTTRNGLRLMFEALSPGRCLADVFAEAYTLPDRGGDSPRPGVATSRSCGGCPACRRSGRAAFVGAMPDPLPIWQRTGLVLDEELARMFGGGSLLFLFDDRSMDHGPAERQRRERMLRWLIAKGVRTIAAPPAVLDRIRPVVRPMEGCFVFFNPGWQPLRLPRVPTLAIWTEEQLPPGLVPAADRCDRLLAPRVLWLPAEVRDPAKPHCRLRDTVRAPSFRIEELCMRIGL
ncbi:protein DpdF [Tautonia plasticadhaerens]|uniref:DNA 3'-5' helicase n=1 Tax=Tautonia plasticadhaerens TaxID=2527974 RepID=A0A518H9K4_9BACT|nr:protein DpdF [Tautonia plasticadhaerens]QDV37416.1 ATP-dependent DNA helicase RecQ [Tautonia plasticadhaerens]